MQTKTQPTACGTLAPTFIVIVDDVRRWAQGVLEGVEGFDDVYGTNLEEVRNTPCDGFFPFTDGGFSGVGYGTLSHAHGSGAVPAAIKPILDSSLKDANAEWDSANPDATVEMIYAGPEPVALEAAGQLVLPGLIADRDDWQRRQHPMLDDYHQHVDGWLEEGGTYFYKVRALFYDVDNSNNVTGKPEAYFFVGINTDLEYGRDNIPWLTYYGRPAQQSQWLWEKNVPLVDITEDLIDAMIKEATDALASA